MSGVFSSCETFDTKSRRIPSSLSSSEVSWITATAPSTSSPPSLAASRGDAFSSNLRWSASGPPAPANRKERLTRARFSIASISAPDSSGWRDNS